MSLPSPTPSTKPDEPTLPVGPILMMLAKGMRPREIVEVFPEVALDAIRGAVLQAAELVNDPEASVARCSLSARAIIEKARRHADLSEEDAMERAVALTRAYRRDKAARPAGSQVSSTRSGPAVPILREPMVPPTSAIVAMVGRGMTVREILSVFPELQPEDVRAALVRAAEVLADPDCSLVGGDPVGGIIRAAQQSSGLSDEGATALAVRVTREVRHARTRRRR